MNILAHTYWTRGNGYEAEFAKLKASAGEFGVTLMDTELRAADFGSWKAVVGYKPQFIYNALVRCLETRVDGILWIDADAIVRRPLDWALFASCDVAWHLFRRYPKADDEFLTGTMFFRVTAPVLEFVEEWALATPAMKFSDTPEQLSLKSTWIKAHAGAWTWKERLRHTDLPPEWVWIFDDFPAIYGKDRRLVIEHHQASRRLKWGEPKRRVK